MNKKLKELNELSDIAEITLLNNQKHIMFEFFLFPPFAIIYSFAFKVNDKFKELNELSDTAVIFLLNKQKHVMPEFFLTRNKCLLLLSDKTICVVLPST